MKSPLGSRLLRNQACPTVRDPGPKRDPSAKRAPEAEHRSQLWRAEPKGVHVGRLRSQNRGLGPDKAAAFALTLSLTLLTASPRPAEATERRFTYTYESGVLRPGDKELEPWTTLRKDKVGYFTRFDERFELEVGVFEHFQSAWYFNFSGISQNEGAGRKTSAQVDGMSWELKYQFSDPVADAFGSAGYFEVTYGPSALELEAKAIFDKRIDNLLLALNVIGTAVWEFGSEKTRATETTEELEGDLGLAYFLSPNASIGVETRLHNLFTEEDGLRYSALFLGPAISWSEKSWWVTLTVQPQITALKGATPPTNVQLEDHERMEARVIFAFHL